MHVFNQNTRTFDWLLNLEQQFIHYILSIILMCLRTDCDLLKPTDENMTQKVKVWTVPAWRLLMVLVLQYDTHRDVILSPDLWTSLGKEKKYLIWSPNIQTDIHLWST